MVKLPNAFSPNDDGINDYWKPEIQGIVNVTEWSVFNRHGQQVFLSRNVATGWDGKSNGKALPGGTYYWIITASDNQNKPIKMNGSVTIIR